MPPELRLADCSDVPGPLHEELPIDPMRQGVGLGVDGARALKRAVAAGETDVANEGPSVLALAVVVQSRAAFVTFRRGWHQCELNDWRYRS